MRKFILFPVFFVLFVTAVTAGTRDNITKLVTDPDRAFVEGSIVVKGEGAAPQDAGASRAQKRIMAIRAAKVEALREVAEIVDGVRIEGETMLVNAVAESDLIRATVQGVIRGAEVVSEAYDPFSGMAAVYVSVPMTGANGLVSSLLPQVVPMYQGGMQAYRPPVEPRETGSYDGLILDVREHSFKPALINRVLTSGGEVVYDPARVAQDILVERGAAEYTNDLGKARALLNERGSTNPMVVKGAELVRATDVKIPDDDANAVFASNLSNNFLEGAKVVFVLH